MKKYSELTIDQKINFKANQLAKGTAYGTLPKGWAPMLMPGIRQELSFCYAFDCVRPYKWK